jgi:drug/metabolite transporter (DMT)-like permease
LIIAAILLLIGCLDGWHLIRNKRWPEATLYGVVMAIGICFVVMTMLSYAPPRVTTPLSAVFVPITRALDSWLMSL